MTDEHKIIPSPDPGPLDPREQLHPLVAALSRGDLDPATMREVLALQREHQKDVALQMYTDAFVDLKKDLPTTIEHDKKVEFKNVKYSHLSLAGLIDAVDGHITEHGFALRFGGAVDGAEILNEPRPGYITVSATLTHRGGHSRSIQGSAPPDTGSGRNAIQAIASTTTYLRRYTASMLLGVATYDMPDPDAPEEMTDEERAAADAVIDVGLNMELAAKLERNELSVYDAEELVGKPTEEWTAADRRSIFDWAKKQKGD